MKCYFCENSLAVQLPESFVKILPQNPHVLLFFGIITDEMKKQSLLKYPLLLEEWDYEYNRTFPNEHSSEDATKVYWKCSKCGYHWQASIKERVYKDTRCPKCSVDSQMTTQKQVVYYYVKQVFPDAINSYKPDFLNGMGIDVYIPSLRVAIEYDGKYWRNLVKRDSRKSELLRKNSVKLIRIKEKDCSNPYDDYAVIKSDYESKLIELLPAIAELFQTISVLSGSPVNVELERDNLALFALSKGAKNSKSLLASEADVLLEWAYDLNKDITPDQVSYRSWKKVWWRCSICGKEYQQSIKFKVKDGLGCNTCLTRSADENKTISEKELSKARFVSEDPNLLSEWNDWKDPATVSCNSKYQAQWKCIKCGHVFTMSVKNRSGHGEGCSICRRRRSAAKRGLAVVNVSTGKVYRSIAAACRDTRIPVESILNCCHGKTSSAGGYKWEYVSKRSRTK